MRNLLSAIASIVLLSSLLPLPTRADSATVTLHNASDFCIFVRVDGNRLPGRGGFQSAAVPSGHNGVFTSADVAPEVIVTAWISHDCRTYDLKDPGISWRGSSQAAMHLTFGFAGHNFALTKS